MSLTTYIILEGVKATAVGENGNDAEVIESEGQQVGTLTFEAFRKIDAVNAHSTDQALRKAAEKHGSGTFIAVSERHWKAETFEVETVSRVKIKSA